MLRVEDLSICFNDRGIRQEAVKNVTFSMNSGEILGIVGESGSGKTMTALTIAGLLKKNAELNSGSVYFSYADQERDLLKLSDSTQNILNS